MAKQKKPPYRALRNRIFGIAVGSIVMSAATGMGLFAWRQPPSAGSLGDFFTGVAAAAQVAVVIPSFAGVLLAAFAVSAYLREEDAIRKSSEAAWSARNSFLFFSDALCDAGTQSLIGGYEFRSSLKAVLPGLKSAFFGTDLGLAIAQLQKVRLGPRFDHPTIVFQLQQNAPPPEDTVTFASQAFSKRRTV